MQETESALASAYAQEALIGILQHWPPALPFSLRLLGDAPGLRALLCVLSHSRFAVASLTPAVLSDPFVASVTARLQYLCRTYRGSNGNKRKREGDDGPSAGPGSSSSPPGSPSASSTLCLPEFLMAEVIRLLRETLERCAEETEEIESVHPYLISDWKRKVEKEGACALFVTLDRRMQLSAKGKQ